MTKKIFLIIIPLVIVSCKVQHTSSSKYKQQKTYISVDRKDYISNYKDMAIKEMNRSGIPASITLAQAMLESDNGNSTLARKANNHFGIKCHSTWRGSKVFHDDDKRGECFRKYNSVYESYKDHSDFIVNGSRYKFLFDHKTSDYKSWAKGLQKAGYATSNTYSSLLIKIVEDNKLYLFDQGGTLLTSDIQVSETDSQIVILGDIDNFSIRVNKHTIYNKNRIDYLIAQEADTYKSITDEFKMLSWELYKYNELEQDAKLSEGDIVYLQPKRSKAQHGSDFHEVKEGETMYSISQFYGIKLKSLYDKNLMKEGSQPEIGQKIWLRKLKTESEREKESSIITNFDVE